MIQYQRHNMCLLHLVMFQRSTTQILLVHVVSRRQMRCRLIVM
uniref:MEI1 n=1 Tax=Arundo donax TaxID=35708 RepID=A0A0A9EFK0_ARUDO